MLYKILTDKFTNFIKDFKMECCIISIDKRLYFKDGNYTKLIYKCHAVPTKITRTLNSTLQAGHNTNLQA